MASRLKSVIGTIIHRDQSGFIPNRYGSDNIRRLVNLQHYVYDSTDPSIALSLDAAKAFDCVEWDYLFRTLAKFGFGNNFITWMRTLYDTPNACVLTNGLISDLFHLQRSTRQGCPLSPGLFVLALEPLAQKLRNHKDFHGLTVGNIHHKLLLYADDMLVFVTQPEKSIPVLLDCIEDFTLLSGYRVNWDKSEAMPMSGHCPSTLFKEWKFRWSSKSIKYLGIQIASDYNNMVKMNLGPLLEKIKIDFGRWSKIHLSLWGKINSIKMMTAPVIFYFLNNIPIYIPDSFFKELDSAILDFLWGSSHHRLSLKKLQTSAERGGFSLPNFKWYYWSLNVKHMRVWLPNSVLSEKPFWFQLECEANGGSSPWSNLFGVKTKAQREHPIISAAKSIWIKLHRAGRWDFFKSPLSPLWNNPKILIGGEPVNWPQWRKQGIINVQHLFDVKTNCILNFDQITVKYNLSHNQFWRYVQLRSTLSKLIGSPLSCPSGSPVEALLRKCLINKGTTSKIYKLLLDQIADPLSKVKKYWAEEFALDISQSDWESCLHNTNTMFKEIGNRFIQLKIIHRWHRTPQQLHRWNLIPTDTCWRCGEHEGSIFHILWSCPALQDWWKNKKEIIYDVLKRRFPISPKLAILGSTLELPDSKFSSFEKRWITLALTTAKRVLLRHWMKKLPPPYEEWLTTMAKLASYEKVTYGLLNKQHHYDYTWSAFTNWLTVPCVG